MSCVINVLAAFLLPLFITASIFSAKLVFSLPSIASGIIFNVAKPLLVSLAWEILAPLFILFPQTIKPSSVRNSAVAEKFSSVSWLIPSSSSAR